MADPRTHGPVRPEVLDEPEVCRCPAGWPVLKALFADSGDRREHWHHLACGMLPTRVGRAGAMTIYALPPEPGPEVTALWDRNEIEAALVERATPPTTEEDHRGV